MSEQERKWVPGFVWVTQYPERVGVAEDPVLVPVAKIVRVRKMSDLWAQIELDKAGAFVAILEKPEQVAALIHQEWRQRVMSEAIVQAEYGSGKYPVEGNVDEQEGT